MHKREGYFFFHMCFPNGSIQGKFVFSILEDRGGKGSGARARMCFDMSYALKY